MGNKNHMKRMGGEGQDSKPREQCGQMQGGREELGDVGTVRSSRHLHHCVSEIRSREGWRLWADHGRCCVPYQGLTCHSSRAVCQSVGPTVSASPQMVMKNSALKAFPRCMG